MTWVLWISCERTIHKPNPWNLFDSVSRSGNYFGPAFFSSIFWRHSYRGVEYVSQNTYIVCCAFVCCGHYGDVIMGTMASQITSLTIVYSTLYSGADQRKHQSSASLDFVGPVNSSHKWPVTPIMFPFDDVILFMLSSLGIQVTYLSIFFRVVPQTLGRLLFWLRNNPKRYFYFSISLKIFPQSPINNRSVLV